MPRGACGLGLGATGTKPTAPSAALRVGSSAHQTLAVMGVHVLQVATVEGKYLEGPHPGCHLGVPQVEDVLVHAGKDTCGHGGS